jgi:hypothetical protein
MKPIYITERGDDKNDGSTVETAVHSWKRALQLSKSGSSEFRIPDRRWRGSTLRSRRSQRNTAVALEADACDPGGPDGVKAGQVEDLVKLYLRDHPENRHDVASSLIIAALKEKFPCGE